MVLRFCLQFQLVVFLGVLVILAMCLILLFSHVEPHLASDSTNQFIIVSSEYVLQYSNCVCSNPTERRTLSTTIRKLLAKKSNIQHCWVELLDAIHYPVSFPHSVKIFTLNLCHCTHIHCIYISITKQLEIMGYLQVSL